MSILVMGWVLRHSEATLGNRLVLLALADFAQEDGGGARPSVATLARHSRLSERQVQYALRALERDGAIEKTGVSSKGCNVYRVLMEGGAESAPVGCNPRHEGVQPVAPDPSMDPLVEDTPSVGSPVSNEVVLQRRTIMVDRKQATEHEITLAALILGFWNREAEQKLMSVDWLRKIIMRIREHPNLTLDDHVALIEKILRDPEPWWKGVATPSIIYGSGAQFERSLVHQPKATATRYGRGMTTAQILAATRQEQE